MKTRMMHWMIAAAALAAAAGSASAQSYNAEIPLAFRVGHQVMAPGSYRIHVNVSSGAPIMQISNLEAKESALLVPQSSGDAPKTWRDGAKAVLGFQCRESRCSLAHFYNGLGRDAYAFATPKPEGEGRLALVTVVLTKAK